MSLEHVLHVSTGGTIASSELGMLGGQALLEHLGTEIPGVRWSHEDAGRIPSSCATPEHFVRLAMRIDSCVREQRPSMVLVTHGTDTMEEAAAVADMVCGDDVPIVFTGAMRAGPGGDGPRNMAHSVRTGLGSTGQDRGVAVVMNGTIHAAIEVRKLHSTADDAFRSHTPLGVVDSEGVQWRDWLPHRLRLPCAEPRHSVRVIRLAAGDPGDQIAEAGDKGIDGLVVELFGAGNAPSEILRIIESTAESGVYIALATRCGEGTIGAACESERVFAMPGIDALKVRLALILGLASGSVDPLKSWAAEHDR